LCPGTLRIPLSGTKNRRKQPERYAQYFLNEEKIVNIEIKLVKKEEREILRNPLEKYSYEFSQWEDNDVNDIGLYGYTYFGNY
jgi:hypothetical protein